jgi:quercetin dioxygenase-like cupin family protein
MLGNRILEMDIVRLMEPAKANARNLAEILRREGLETEMCVDPPGTKYGRHKHEFDEFVVIVSGMMKLYTERQTWIMKPGDRLNIPAFTVHWSEVLGNKEVRYLSAAK